MWERFRALQGGVLVVGHGTRIAMGVEQLVELANQIQDRIPSIPTEPSFLELANPTIAEAMIRLRIQGVRRVLVVPILLFEAAHAQTDIPDAVREAANDEGLMIVGQSPPLGTHASALALSQFRFMQGLRCRQTAGCLRAGACDRAIECFGERELPRMPGIPMAEIGSIGLAMVGRGTSDRTALDHMRRFTALRVLHSPFPIAWVETGFFCRRSTECR